MSETTQEERQELLDEIRPITERTLRLFRDADRLAHLEDGIQALEDALRAEGPGRTDTLFLASRLRALLDD